MSNQGVVAKLRIFTEEFPKGVQKEQVKCVKNVGIEGDKYAKGGERQVTLQDQAVREWMNQQSGKGLCVARFKENITVSGMDFSLLSDGAEVQVGEVKLKISEWQKKCYGKECEVYSTERECPALQGCCFAKVIESGEIAVGMDIVLL